MEVQIILKSIAAGLFGFMFAGVWTQAGEIFGWIPALIYKYIYPRSQALYTFLTKVFTCPKCMAVWVFLILFATPQYVSIFAFGVAFASFIGLKLDKWQQRQN